jgi:hypothetical protein
LTIPDQQRHTSRLAELGFSENLFGTILSQAATDVRSCTDFDAPGARGYLFWSRANRYLAEELTADSVDPSWCRTSRDNILRMIHPKRSHAITAISAEGKIGDLNRPVRSKNPKGTAMQRLVEKNGQLAFLSHDEALFGIELDQIPTWCLLYKRVGGTVEAELSMPVAMNGKYVNEWLERIPLHLNGISDPGDDLNILDTPPEDGRGPDFDVAWMAE